MHLVHLHLMNITHYYSKKRKTAQTTQPVFRKNGTQKSGDGR